MGHVPKLQRVYIENIKSSTLFAFSGLYNPVTDIEPRIYETRRDHPADDRSRKSGSFHSGKPDEYSENSQTTQKQCYDQQPDYQGYFRMSGGVGQPFNEQLK